MTTIILVPGAYHGGWYYSPIIPALRAAGHEVHSLSLSGLGGPANRSATAINLQTHIDDVVSHVELERLDDLLLCGHSYGGMVIAGAADCLGGRVRAMLFLDALVPANGDSVWSVWDPVVRDMFVTAAPDGILTAPPPGVDPRARAHPLASFLQPIVLSDVAYAAAHKVYAWCNGRSNSPFEAIYERLSADAAWRTHQLACGHDVMSEAPDLALKLLLETASLSE